MNQERRNLKHGNPGSRPSTKTFILIYSRLQTGKETTAPLESQQSDLNLCVRGAPRHDVVYGYTVFLVDFALLI